MVRHHVRKTLVTRRCSFFTTARPYLSLRLASSGSIDVQHSLIGYSTLRRAPSIQKLAGSYSATTSLAYIQPLSSIAGRAFMRAWIARHMAASLYSGRSARRAGIFLTPRDCLSRLVMQLSIFLVFHIS